MLQFHALSWWLQRKLSALAEDACDVAVMRQGHDPGEYAEYLIDMVRSVKQAGARVTLWGTTIDGSRLSARIRRMLDRGTVPVVWRTRASVAVVVCSMTLLTFAGCKLGRAQKPAPGQSSMNAMAHRAADEIKKSAEMEAALLAEARTLTTEQVQAKIAALKAHPQDGRTYYEIMRYYEYKSDPKGKNALILWYIEHEPGGEVRPWNINPVWDSAGYQQGKKLWLAHVRQGGASAEIYSRAASFLEGSDKPLAEALLLEARQAYPKDKRWASSLGSHYAQVLLGSAEPLTEYGVFRAVSSKEALSPYAKSVRTKLAVSDDASLLAYTAQTLAVSALGFRDHEVMELAAAYADRALVLQPDNDLARSLKFRVERLKDGLRIQELAKLPAAERAQLSDTDRMMLALGEMERTRYQKIDDSVAKAREVLDLVSRNPNSPKRGEAIYKANIVLGIAALRNADKRKAAQYLLAAADTPGSEQMRHGDISMDMNLMRALVDWGERDAVAQFLERMAPKTNRTREFLDWAAQIRKGINPDILPTFTYEGCAKDPC